MASGPITSWQIHGETMETMTDYLFLGSKITADGDCSHEIKRRLLLGRKVMTNLDSILKSRDITLLTKVSLVKAIVFPVVMYGCESWTIKLSTEELMLLNCGVGEDSSESLGLKGDPTSPSKRKSVLNILWKDWCWNWKLQYFGCLMRRTDSLEKTLMLGKIEGRRREWQKMRWLDGITDSMDMNESESTPGVGDGQGGLGCCSPWSRKEVDTTEQLNWTPVGLNSYIYHLESYLHSNINSLTPPPGTSCKY